MTDEFLYPTLQNPQSVPQKCDIRVVNSLQTEQ